MLGSDLSHRSIEVNGGRQRRGIGVGVEWSGSALDAILIER